VYGGGHYGRKEPISKIPYSKISDMFKFLFSSPRVMNDKIEI
jgi:hypothetical protein